MDEDAEQQDLLSKIPPYWQHRRHESNASANTVPPFRIILEDRTEHSAELAAPLWAKGVQVDSYVVVSGKLPSIGDYIVWNCKIATIDVSDLSVEVSIGLCVLRNLFLLFCTESGAMLGRAHRHQKEVDV